MTLYAPPSDDVAQLVALLGEEATLRLLEKRGGTRVYLSDPEEHRTISELVGIDGAGKLNAAYGRTQIKVPLGRTWRVLCYRAQGMSYRETALKAGCTEGTVWDILRRHGQTQTQLDLFKTA